MDAIKTNYIPREYLALRINACKMALDKLPITSISTKKIRGTKTPVCYVDNHTYTSKSKLGQHYFELAEKRESYQSELDTALACWHSYFKGAVPDDITPRKVVRKYINHIGEHVTLNGEFFESLKNDANPDYPESKKYFFNGVYYRSVAEKEIAEFYTIHGIPFKYEPEIWITGMNKPIHPDFVIYIKELDCCKIHEHLGMMSFVTYLRVTKNKYEMYTNAGLIPGFDILFTYNTEELPFDIRIMWPQLNAMVYSSLFAK